MNTPKLFDVHTHVAFAAFLGEEIDVIRRALDEKIWMANVGTQRDTSRLAIERAEEFSEGVYATVGLHPIHTERSYHDKLELGDNGASDGFTSRGEEFDFDYYQKLAEHPKVVAIGECGLDYFRLGEETKTKQREVFLAQIFLSKKVKKPLMIHCRNAFKDLRVLLHERSADLLSTNPGIIHFMTGTVEDAQDLLRLGFMFSFGGAITFARDYDEVVRAIPIDRILLETDAPYVAPEPYRGKRNEPLYITEVAKKIAQIKDISPEEIGEQTTENAKKVFGLKSLIPN